MEGNRLFVDLFNYIKSNNCVFRVVYDDIAEMSPLVNHSETVLSLTLSSILLKDISEIKYLVHVLMGDLKMQGNFIIYISSNLKNCVILKTATAPLTFAFDLEPTLYNNLIKYRVFNGL